MAQNSTSDTRLNANSAPPLQISKDVQGSDNPIPLSPQWLLSKPGENKSGTGLMENHVISNPSHGSRPETVKISGDGEDAQKRKDVFRPSMFDSESGRRDRWRDEERDTERDTKSSIRKDRWRDGDKDLGDSRKVDRWGENPAPKNLGEARRVTSDSNRWNDSGNRDANFDQRRESKWNSRWGPNDKDPEGLREKWSDSGKDGDIHLDKGLSHGKDEKDGDHIRPWRPNFAQNRGRVEPPHSQSTPPHKQGSTFSYGRGRAENTPPPVFSPGHGRGGSGGSSFNSTYPGTALDKAESVHEEPCPFRYNRTRLLDVYRVTNMGRNRKFVDDFVQVPSLTQDEPLEPLALMTPSSEELSILNGIDKGEIISSSAPQVTKDGRGSTDFTHTRRMKPGTTPLQDRGEDGGSYKVADELSSNRDSSFEGNSSLHSGAAWRANSRDEHTGTLLHNSRDVPSDVRLRKSDESSHQPNDPQSHWESKLGFVSESKEVGKWSASEDTIVKRQLSGTLESEHGTRRVPPTAPEELSLLYKDPKGLIQGPFKGIDIIGWFEAGYFGIDLPVRLENSAADSPWFSLGDVMPHLRAKARPPPGFSAPQPELADITGRQNPATFGNAVSGLSEVEMLKSDPRHRQGPDTGIENRYLESLMSGNRSSPTINNLALSEGFQGFAGNNPGNLGPSGVDSGSNIYLLAKRMELERQMSLPTNSYPYWPGQDAASLAPKSDVPDVSLHSKLLSSVSDNSRQPQSQSSEWLSLVQGLSDRTSAGINNGTAGWPNNSLQGGMDLLQNKVDSRHDQNFPQMPFGIQQPRLTPQNQLSLSNLLAQAADSPASSLTAEKLLSSGLSQDPQVINLLQQQYLLQLHSQAAASAPQLPLIDKLLLLKQQQKQEEQQLLLRQQQQQLLSKMLQDQQSSQLFGNSSYGQLQSALPMGNLRVDPSQLQPPQEIFPMSSQIPIPSVHSDLSTDSMNLHLKVSQDTSYTVNSKTSTMRLPHQLFGDTIPQNNWAPTLAEQINENHKKEIASPHVESSLVNDLNRSKEEPHIVQESVFDYTAKSSEQLQDSALKPDNGAIPAISMPSIHLQSDAPAVDKSSAGSSEVELLPASRGSDVKIKSDIAHQEQLAGIDSSNAVHVETHEPKKANEKKSKKQKSSKQSSDQSKGLLKNTTLQPSKQSEVEIPNFNELGGTNKDEPHETYLQKTRSKASHVEETDALETAEYRETVFAGDSKAVSSVSTINAEVPAGRAWKPAPSVKAKSLLEIQQEEKRKAQTETLVSDVTASVNSMSMATPWAGVASYPDSVKVSSESRGGNNTESPVNAQISHNLKSKKSPLHDLLAEEVLKKSNEKEVEVTDSTFSSHDIAVHSESTDGSNFIEAKDTKRSRKKSGKSKGSGVKAPVPVASAEVPISSSPVEKIKSSRSAQQEKEVLPSIPAGPSLGDFVVWKGEREQPIQSSSPAWSTDSGRVPKPTSLRDILKEQGKKTSAIPASPVPTPQKSHPAQANWNSTSSRSISASSPSKAASPLPINSHASNQSKYKGDDDLFWGPIEPSKQETKQSDFPQLASQGSWGSKNVPLKGNSSGLLARQKSASGKPTERPLSSSPASSQSALKLKNDAMTKHSEAMGFRDWCENECVRLIGTKDTSFLEFCLKQSRSEAETLLIENLGSFDPDHQFIDKFLNYKEMLPSDVLDIAFQSKHGKEVNGLGASAMASANADIQDVDHTEGSSKGGGKKKGKKGKKVSPLVLGFNVVSNRIMMGEIQTVED
ncbi:GYF domain-containing protein [Trifolium repens]|nr:GYF domain-containing protein [Trifolium repens]